MSTRADLAVRHFASGIVASALEVMVFSPQLTRSAVQLYYPGAASRQYGDVGHFAIEIYLPVRATNKDESR